MARTKPLGITLIALYNAVFAVMFLPIGCMTTLAAGIPNVPQYTGLIGFFFLGFGVLLAATVYGLWTLQDWGRSLTAWMNIISLPLAGLSIFGLFPGTQVSMSNTIVDVVCIALAIWIIQYLMSNPIKALFQGDGSVSYRRVEPGSY
jgi:uncharacterized membrane protein (DUF2068 family)